MCSSPETIPSSCFKVVQIDPIFGTFAGHNQSFSKGSYIFYYFFTISKPKKVPQKPTKSVRKCFLLGFCSMVSGVTNGPPGCWIRSRYSKVTAVLSRRLETGLSWCVHKARGWCWNHDFFFWRRLGWFGSRKFGVEIVKTKWLSHVLTWKKMKRSLKDLYVETQWLWYKANLVQNLPTGWHELANRMAWTFSATQGEPSYCKPSFFVWIDSADKGIKFRVTSDITQWFDQGNFMQSSFVQESNQYLTHLRPILWLQYSI